MLKSKQDRAIEIATRLVGSDVPAVEFAERLTRCEYEGYLGINIFVEDLNEFSTYFVIDGDYENLMASDTAENAKIAWVVAKEWVRDFHARSDDDD